MNYLLKSNLDKRQEQEHEDYVFIDNLTVSILGFLVMLPLAILPMSAI